VLDARALQSAGTPRKSSRRAAAALAAVSCSGADLSGGRPGFDRLPTVAAERDRIVEPPCLCYPHGMPRRLRRSLVVRLARAPRAGAAVVRRRRVARFEQLGLDFELAPPRWSFSRLVLRSRHFERIRERIEFVRGFFPEMAGVTIRVGLAQKRGVLGWGSLDPERPGIWIRPRRIELFTIAHEMTHLLQARGIVPRGERQCDLWAMARSPLVIDSPPSYLKLPRRLKQRPVRTDHATLLHRLARECVDARERGDRRYLQMFEGAIVGAAER